MSLECSLHICCSVFKHDASVLVALSDPLVEQVRDTQELLLTRPPHTYHDRSWCDAGARTGILRRRLLRGLVEVLLDTLEESINVFPDIFGGEFFDDFLESGFIVGAVCGYFAWCCRLEQTFDALEVVLRQTHQNEGD